MRWSRCCSTERELSSTPGGSSTAAVEWDAVEPSPASSAQTRRVTPSELPHAALDAAASDRRLEAIERALMAVRALRAEVEHVRPGLVLERVDGWHSDTAELYGARAVEVRYALAGAERVLLEAESELEAARRRAHAARAGGVEVGSLTPGDQVSSAGARR